MAGPKSMVSGELASQRPEREPHIKSRVLKCYCARKNKTVLDTHDTQDTNRKEVPFLESKYTVDIARQQIGRNCTCFPEAAAIQFGRLNAPP